MHERTQRAVARLMFVFCCAVPTAMTVICVLATWTPWYHQRTLRWMEVGLSQDTGLVVEIDDFRRAAPSAWNLFGIRISDPETGLEVARVRQLQWISEAGETSLLLHQPELQSSQLAHAWRMIHDRFLCRPDRTSSPIVVAGNDLTIHSGAGSMTFQDMDAWIRPHEKVVEATIQCLPANARSVAPIEITVRRDRASEEPKTDWILRSGGTALPCSTLADFLPVMEAIGSEASFTGTLSWQLQANQWSLDLGGSRFENVSLDRLFEKHSHRLSGLASIQFERCRIEPHRRRSDIAGSIRARDGWIGRALLVSAQQNLGFEVRLPAGLAETPGPIPYDRIAIGFNINNTQLELRGVCRTESGYENYPAGVVMLRDGLPLVYSSEQTLASMNVIAAIAPAHSVPVPMSSQTRAMMNVFIPPSRPLPRDERFPPRIRSAEVWRGGPTVSQP